MALFEFKRIPPGFQNKQMWKDLGYMILGGATGEIVNAALQGLPGKKEDGTYVNDMTGLKGDLISGALVAAVGLGFNRPMIAVGTLGTKLMKRVYVYGNPYIAQVLGSPIPPVDKKGQVGLSDAANEYMMTPAEQLPPFMEYITRPNGQRVLVSTGQAGVAPSAPALPETTSNVPLQDYGNVPLADYANVPLSDYSNAPLADYTPQPFAAQPTLNDNWEDFAQAVAGGYYN